MVQKIKSSNLDADVLTGNTELAEAANNSDTVLVHDTSAGALKKIQVSNLTAQAGDGLSKSSTTLAVDISGTTLLDEGAASGDLVLVYDTSAGILKRVTQANLLNFPTVSSVSPTSVTSGDGTGNYTFTITGTGFTGGSANLIGNDGSSVSFDTVTADSDTQITAVIAKSSLDGANEPFDVRVTGNQGLASTLENQINIDQQPVFSTASGSLGSIANHARSGNTFTVVAADPESGGDVTYTLESGSLPTNMTLTSTSSGAVISGTPDAVASDTTSTFTIRAKDVNSNTSDRQFSITVNGPSTTSFTSSGTFSVPSGVTTVDVLVVAGGGSGGGGYHQGCGQAGGSGGGGAGGLIYRPGFPVTPGGTVSVTVGNGGPSKAAANPAAVGAAGQDSVFGTLTAKGGGGGGATSCSQSIYDGQPGGSGGGGADTGIGSANSSGGSATQPTQSGESGNYGFGNAGSGVPGPGNFGGGGGGGAGAAGSTHPGGSTGAAGGVGKAYTIADGTTSVYYAGGGGGAGGAGSAPGGAGGQGGGGEGGVFSPCTSGQDGTANRGGGSGGGAETTSSGSGGKGIVLVRF